MQVRLDYGRQGLAVEVPDRNLLMVVEAPPVAAAKEPAEIVRDALVRPKSGAPLAELARGKQSACVVIPDVTRPMPNHVILPELLQALEQGGIPREAISILVATGLHRPNVGEELVEMVGYDIVQRYRIHNHDAKDEASHFDLGTNSLGVPMLVDRRYVDSDLKILTGLVEPHFMAGFSGGRKLVCPGLCAERTINEFHSPRFIEHERSRNLVLEENPVHKAATETAMAEGVDFTLNVVLSSHRTLIAAFGGGLEPAFAAATQRAKDTAACRVSREADLVIVSGGGHPLDATWYQTIKGIVAAMPAVREGGHILCASGMSEGLGSSDFSRMLASCSDLETFMAEIRKPGVHMHEQWQLEEFALAARRASIWLFSEGIPQSAQEKLFVTPVGSIEDGISRVLSAAGDEASITVMPHGPYVLPVIAG